MVEWNFFPRTNPSNTGLANPVTVLGSQAESSQLQPINIDEFGRLEVSAVSSGAAGLVSILAGTSGGQSVVVSGEVGVPGGVTVNALASGVIGSVRVLAGTSGAIGSVAILAATLASGQAFAAMQPSPVGRFNGVSIDLERANIETPTSIHTLTTVLAGTSTSADQINHNGRGVAVYPNITFISGNPSVTVLLLGKDPVSATYYSILGSATITALGMYPIIAYPGGANIANHQAAEIVPRTWAVRTVIAAGSADSAVTATIGAVTMV